MCLDETDENRFGQNCVKIMHRVSSQQLCGFNDFILRLYGFFLLNIRNHDTRRSCSVISGTVQKSMVFDHQWGWWSAQKPMIFHILKTLSINYSTVLYV